MQVKFEHDRLCMLPEDVDEGRFVKVLVRRVEDSNFLMGWYGDAEFDGKEISAYIITWQPDKEPKVIPAAEVK